jgi:hypothetical protein
MIMKMSALGGECERARGERKIRGEGGGGAARNCFVLFACECAKMLRCAPARSRHNPACRSASMKGRVCKTSSRLLFMGCSASCLFMECSASSVGRRHIGALELVLDILAHSSSSSLGKTYRRTRARPASARAAPNAPLRYDCSPCALATSSTHRLLPSSPPSAMCAGALEL